MLAIMMAMAMGATAHPSAGRDPEVLQRSGKWVVNYDRDSCQLFGQFGTGKDLLIARFTKYQPSDWFNFSLYGRRVKSTDAFVDAEIDFGPAGNVLERRGMNGSAAKMPAILFDVLRLDEWDWGSGSPVPDVTPGQEAAVTGVTVDIDGKKPFRLEFGPLDGPMAEMRKCLENLVRSWGYDPAARAKFQRYPIPASDPRTWIKDRDYPLRAIVNGSNGMVQFRLDVDAEGNVAGCYILARSSPDEFADTTCRRLRERARFTPALDGEGKPARSFYINRVRFQMSRG